MDALIPALMDKQGYSQMFEDRIPTLQQLTSFNIARSLWYAIFFGEDYEENGNELGYYLKESYRELVDQYSEFLQDYIPSHLVSHLIKDSTRKVHSEINGWRLYNKSNTLPDHEMSIFCDHLECLVWRIDGKIDHIQTARKMLSLDSLSQVDKFAIMCRYCLEDEFDKFPVNKVLENVLAKVIRQRRSCLAFYWICKLKKDLRGMQFDANFESLESFMITEMGHEDFYAIEYFWNCLSEQDQVTKAAFLFKDWRLVRPLQNRLLSKMNEFQLGQIFTKIPVEIVASFWNSSQLKEPEIPFLIWTRMKHLISGEQFGDLLRRILPSAINYTDGSVPLVIKLWDTACDHHKKFILDQEKNIIERYFSCNTVSVSKMLQFLCAVLSYSSPNYRKEFILERGVKLLVKYHSDNVLPSSDSHKRYEFNYSDVDRVIKYCLPNDSEVVEFQKNMMKSSEAVDLCKSIFSQGLFEKLNKFIEFYSPDVSTMSDFKKVIWDSSQFESYHIFLPGNWIEVEKFVDDAYPDAILAKNMKRQLILTSGTRSLNDCMNADSLRSMINITAEFLTNEEIVKIKDSLLPQLRRKLMSWYAWKSIDETYWREFESFCFEGEEKINELFTFSIDKIFSENFSLMISKHIREANFIVDMVSVMDNFLKWYFVEPERIRKFKLRRIFESCDLSVIETLIAKPGKKYIKTLLIWFLDNDEEQISKFKTKFSHKNVSQFI